MKFIKKNKSKLLKCLVCIIVVITLILCFAFSTSAIQIDGAEFDGVSVYAVTLTLEASDGSFIPVEITGCYSLQNPDGWPEGLYVEALTTNGNLLNANQTYILRCSIQVESYLQGGNNYVIGGYSVCFPAQYTNITDYGSQRFGSTGDTSAGKFQRPKTIKEASFWDLNGYNYYYDKGTLGLWYNHYSTNLKFTPTVNSTNLLFYIVDIDFDVLSPQEYASRQVIENQNDNTDKILNSGDYAKPSDDDKDIVDKSNKEEEALQEAAEVGFNWFKNTFTFSHDYFDEGVGNGMKVVKKMWEGIISLPYMEKLILWSVLLGAISVLVNCAGAIGRLTSRGKGGK